LGSSLILPLLQAADRPQMRLKAPRFQNSAQWVAKVMAERSARTPTISAPGRRHLVEAAREAERVDAIRADAPEQIE
jgi:hypothetical protein